MVKLSGCALLAVVLLSAAGDLSAGSGSEAGVVLTAPSSGRGVHSRETGRLEQIFEKLSLTDEQKLSVKTIIATADPSMKSLREQIDANKSKLWNMQPDDPNYASAVAEISQANGALVSQRTTQLADIRGQLFALLTADQKARLATITAAMLSNPDRHEGEARSGGHRETRIRSSSRLTSSRNRTAIPERWWLVI